MTVYPAAIDDDRSIIRIDDNITTLGTEAINQLREAAFSIEKTIGINPQGSLNSLNDRISVSLNADGTLRQSAINAAGLVSLPISNNQISVNAGIEESKLDLAHTTTDLFTQASANTTNLISLASFATQINTDLLLHIGGAVVLSNGTTPGRHVASHIDLNAVPSDPRDPSFFWDGLTDKDGNPRTATQTASALLQINDALTTHENLTLGAHPATAITVDVSEFTEIPSTADNVQLALDALDDSDRLQIGIHRAVMHDNAVPRTARSQLIGGPDGYSVNVVPPTLAQAFLVSPPATFPVDSNTRGDDVVRFLPDNTGFAFDAAFRRVLPGDILRINYGNGLTARYFVKDVRFTPGSEWFVRLNGVNLSNADGYDGYNLDGYDAYARIDRPLFDPNTFGVFPTASANNDIDNALIGSVVVGSPRGATAVGLNFDPGQLDSSHYLLYLQLYPTGNPSEFAFTLPGIDVTGNAGATPGRYTLESVVAATNDSLRAAGFNFRFIAFASSGSFGIMLADSIENASFSIINGVVSGASLVTGSFTNNVVGDATDNLDALGLGQTAAGFASPQFNATFSSTLAAANFSTLVITPLRERNAIINGVRRDSFDETFMTTGDGYWNATITDRDVIGTSTVEVEYRIDLDLSPAGLLPGKTLVVQPVVGRASSAYSLNDYGRFIIKDVSFAKPCPGDPFRTFIRVINGIHATGNVVDTSAPVGTQVKIYFGYDSVGFNKENLVDPLPTGILYNRYHEVYIDNQGQTFAHERARMPKQPESTEMLATETNWTIKDVSPKFRGFLDDTATDFRRFVRFYVLEYDFVTGEYDGYLGAADGATGITEFGAITRGRKNVPVRFFDSSNVDFIELEFTEESSTATSILSTSSPRFVDIELFPTLRLDDELFLLGSCELDNTRVECVRDRREFGAVSEKNLSTSALRFIESGERFLHGNGVVQGFEFQGASTTDTATLDFQGGIALVNGTFFALDDLSVRIPEVVLTNTTPNTNILDWAICVNDKGNLVAVALTTSKLQFFANPGSGSDYYIDSASFQELVNVRKDLTIIAVANVTISSVLVNSVTDARKIIANETSQIPLSVFSTENDQDIGNFTSFEAAVLWINGLGGNFPFTVKVRGVQEFDASIDLSGVTVPVIFEGEDAVIKFESVNRGIIVNSNQTFRNIRFEYIPSNVVTNPADSIQSGNGCIFREILQGERLDNIVIENCEFEAFEFVRRPPFINVVVDVNTVVDGLIVRNCRFLDEPITNSRFGACVAVINNNNQASINPAILANSRFENNKTSLEQGFYITSVAVGSTVVETPGIATYNCKIAGNQCGAIGYLVSSEATFELNFDGYLRPRDLLIEGNTCNYIATTQSEGLTLIPIIGASVFIEHATGDVRIVNNHANWIQPSFVTSDVNPNLESTLIVSGNTLTGYDFSGYLFPNFGFGATNDAIRVFGPSDGYALGAAVVTGNTIQAGEQRGVEYLYGNGISNQVKATIKDNSISGFSPTGPLDGYGIISAFAEEVIIQSNQIYRGEEVINGYVAAFSADTLTGGQIVDNIFDDFVTGQTPDDFFVVKIPQGVWYNERNINQRKLIQIDASAGSHGLEAGGVGGEQFVLVNLATFIGEESIVISPPHQTASPDVQYRLISGDIDFVSYYPLQSILPPHAKIVSISFTVQLSSPNSLTPPTEGDVRLGIGALGQPTISTTLDLLLDFNLPAQLITLPVGSNFGTPVTSYVNDPGSSPTIFFVAELSNAAPIDEYRISVNEMFITYTY